MGRGHVGVHAHRHRERGAARAGDLLAEHRGGEDVGSGSPVLLVVLDTQEAQLAHPRPDGLGDLPRILPRLDVRLDLLLDEGPHRLPEHLVVVLEDLHAPHLALTASRSTAPSAPRGRASVNTTTCGRLKRAIRSPTKSVTCWALGRAPPAPSTPAFPASPHRGSGTPYTQTPVTAGICTMTVSTSAG